MASVTLVTGSGTTRLGQGHRMADLPWIFIGGEVSTHSIATATGDFVYYELDNSVLPVYRLQCYDDIQISPQTSDYEKYCNGVKVMGKKLEGFQTTFRLTDDTVDLEQLRVLSRQPSENYDRVGGIHNMEKLLMDNFEEDTIWPVVFEHHYKQDGSDVDQWAAILAFEAKLSIGDIPIDPVEGWTTTITIDIQRSTTYNGYLIMQRRDSTQITGNTV